MSTPYSAPWSTTLKVVTTAVCAMFAVGWLALYQAPGQMGPGRYIGLVLLPVVLALAALFVVRGYEIQGAHLRIRRLLWWTRIPLAGLLSAQADPKATRASVRLWGNGGFFSFSGWFANRQLGRYRLYATDVPRSVVLTFDQRRPVVVTPGSPARFVGEIRVAAGLQSP